MGDSERWCNDGPVWSSWWRCRDSWLGERGHQIVIEMRDGSESLRQLELEIKTCNLNAMVTCKRLVQWVILVAVVIESGRRWINKIACDSWAYGKDQFKKEIIKLKTQLLGRGFGFIVACFLGLTEVRPMFAFFLSQSLPICFKCGRRDGSMWFEIRNVAKVSIISVINNINKTQISFRLTLVHCFLLLSSWYRSLLSCNSCSSWGLWQR